jgi:outer membrane protein assembly factor BamB
MKASVLTQHNDNQRTGVNSGEPTLSPDAVRQHFRRLATLRVDPPEEGGPGGWDSQIVAQPLLASGVDEGGGVKKDVLVVATMHGTVYAFDATHNDNPNHTYPRLWAVWLGPPVLTFPGGDQKDIWQTNPEWGILGTPVIDAGRKKVYVVAWNPDNGGTYRLHALDLASGNRVAGPEILQGSAAGPNGDVRFDAVFQKQRPGLLLMRPEDVPPGRRNDVGPDGTLYVAFGASAEGMVIQGRPTYSGWVFACDARTLNVRGRPWCAAPRGLRGGVWQAGQGLVGSPEGDVFLMTGDGAFDGVTDFGQSVVRLSGKDLNVVDFFTPWDWAEQVAVDNDLGSSGPVYVADGPFVVGGGKEGILYSIDPNQMGKVGNHQTHQDPSLDRVQATADPPAWKTHPPPAGWDLGHHIHGSPVYYAPLRRLYVWGENDVLRSFSVDAQGKFQVPAQHLGDVAAPSGMPGGLLSLTSDGDRHPILWALMPAPAPFDPNNRFKADANRTRLVKGVLRALDAATLKEIWNSDAPGGGLPWNFAKFSPPTLANNRAYVPTYDGELVVFGLG